MSDVSDLIARFRRAVLARESEASRRIIAVYGKAWEVVQAEMRRFYDKLDEEARRTGMTLAEVAEANPSWPYRANNLRVFSERIALELRAVVTEAGAQVEAAQSAGVSLGLQHAEELIRQGILSGLRAPLSTEVTAALSAVWNQPNIPALQNLVGMLGDGRPLALLFREYAMAAAQRLSDTLLRGFVLGKGPRQVAKWLQADMGGSLSRALTVSRTEIIRAYRAAKSDSFRANSDLVSSWRWIAAADACDICAELNGEVFPISEDQESHPNCRCTQQPLTPSYAELAKTLGVPELATIPESVAASAAA